jgi:transcriptional regulator with XRE-family HTH domain
MDFDPRYQERKNGYLKEEVRQRFQALRNRGFTLKDVGDAVGLSGPFISHLLNEKSPGNIRSVKIPNLISALESAEAKSQNSARAIPASPDSTETLEHHIRSIQAMGFEVTVRAK